MFSANVLEIGRWTSTVAMCFLRFFGFADLAIMAKSPTPYIGSKVPDMVANVNAATQTRTERLQMALPYRNEERSGLMLRCLIGIGTTLQKHSAHRMMSLHCCDVQGAGAAAPDGFRPICWRPTWNVVAKKLRDDVAETFPQCRAACATLYFVTIINLRHPEANLHVDFRRAITVSPIHMSKQSPIFSRPLVLRLHTSHILTQHSFLRSAICYSIQIKIQKLGGVKQAEGSDCL